MAKTVRIGDTIRQIHPSPFTSLDNPYWKKKLPYGFQYYINLLVSAALMVRPNNKPEFSAVVMEELYFRRNEELRQLPRVSYLDQLKAKVERRESAAEEERKIAESTCSRCRQALYPSRLSGLNDAYSGYYSSPFSMESEDFCSDILCCPFAAGFQESVPTDVVKHTEIIYSLEEETSLRDVGIQVNLGTDQGIQVTSMDPVPVNTVSVVQLCLPYRSPSIESDSHPCSICSCIHQPRPAPPLCRPESLSFPIQSSGVKSLSYTKSTRKRSGTANSTERRSSATSAEHLCICDGRSVGKTFAKDSNFFGCVARVVEEMALADLERESTPSSRRASLSTVVSLQSQAEMYEGGGDSSMYTYRVQREWSEELELCFCDNDLALKNTNCHAGGDDRQPSQCEPRCLCNHSLGNPMCACQMDILGEMVNYRCHQHSLFIPDSTVDCKTKQPSTDLPFPPQQRQCQEQVSQPLGNPAASKQMRWPAQSVSEWNNTVVWGRCVPPCVVLPQPDTFRPDGWGSPPHCSKSLVRPCSLTPPPDVCMQHNDLLLPQNQCFCRLVGLHPPVLLPQACCHSHLYCPMMGAELPCRGDYPLVHVNMPEQMPLGLARGELCRAGEAHLLRYFQGLQGSPLAEMETYPYCEMKGKRHSVGEVKTLDGDQDQTSNIEPDPQLSSTHSNPIPPNPPPTPETLSQSGWWSEFLLEAGKAGVQYLPQDFSTRQKPGSPKSKSALKGSSADAEAKNMPTSTGKPPGQSSGIAERGPSSTSKVRHRSGELISYAGGTLHARPCGCLYRPVVNRALPNDVHLCPCLIYFFKRLEEYGMKLDKETSAVLAEWSNAHSCYDQKEQLRGQLPFQQTAKQQRPETAPATRSDKTISTQTTTNQEWAKNESRKRAQSIPHSFKLSFTCPAQPDPAVSQPPCECETETKDTPSNLTPGGLKPKYPGYLSTAASTERGGQETDNTDWSMAVQYDSNSIGGEMIQSQSGRGSISRKGALGESDGNNTDQASTQTSCDTSDKSSDRPAVPVSDEDVKRVIDKCIFLSCLSLDGVPDIVLKQDHAVGCVCPCGVEEAVPQNGNKETFPQNGNIKAFPQNDNKETFCETCKKETVPQNSDKKTVHQYGDEKAVSSNGNENALSPNEDDKTVSPNVDDKTVSPNVDDQKTVSATSKEGGSDHYNECQSVQTPGISVSEPPDNSPACSAPKPHQGPSQPVDVNINVEVNTLFDSDTFLHQMKQHISDAFHQIKESEQEALDFQKRHRGIVNDIQKSVMTLKSGGETARKEAPVKTGKDSTCNMCDRSASDKQPEQPGKQPDTALNQNTAVTDSERQQEKGRESVPLQQSDRDPSIDTDDGGKHSEPQLSQLAHFFQTEEPTEPSELTTPLISVTSVQEPYVSSVHANYNDY